MADTVPMISVSAEAEDENFSLSDSEEAQKAKTMIASRMRRRQKQKKKKSDEVSKSSILLVDDGDESGLTDVETVEVDQDGSSRENSASNSPAEDFTPIFDAALQPQIVQIVDDLDGKTHVKTIVKGVVASLDDSDISDDGEVKMSLMEALTDIEDFDDSDREDSDNGKSDSSEMNRLIGQLELGGNVNTHNAEEEMTHRPSSQYQPKTSNSSMLLCPKPSGGRKKPRKSRTKKKASSASSESSALLTVTTPDDGPVTDVESISGVDESEEHPPRMPANEGPTVVTLKVDEIADGGATDVEEFPFSDEDDMVLNTRLAPGILVTEETSETESSYDCSGRSSRLGLTDVESIHGVEDENAPPPPLQGSSGLSVPQNPDDPVTDIEDVDNVEEEEPSVTVPLIPRNGPALHAGQQHVVTIQEDENGKVTSRKYAGSPGLLGFVDSSQQEEGGLTDVEYLGTSGDEDDRVPRGATPEIEMFAGSTVHVSSLAPRSPMPDSHSDASDNESAQTGSKGYSLMPPVQAVDILTDTEDMDVSDGETMANTGQTTPRRFPLRGDFQCRSVDASAI